MSDCLSEENSENSKKWYEYEYNPVTLLLRRQNERRLKELDARLNKLKNADRSPRPVAHVSSNDVSEQTVEINGEKRWYEYDLNPVSFLLQGYHRRRMEKLEAKLNTARNSIHAN